MNGISRNLANLFDLPHITMRTRLIIAKRMAREISDLDAFDRRAFNQFKRRLSRGKPFTHGVLKTAEENRSLRCEIIADTRCAIGQWLMHSVTRQQLSRELGVDGLCDVLEINPVHRGSDELKTIESDQLLDLLLFVHGLEDSAAHLSGRREADHIKSPLHACYFAAFMRLMRDHPDALPDPFAPGAPLHGVSVGHMRADGAISRAPPKLVLHDFTKSPKAPEIFPAPQQYEGTKQMDIVPFPTQQRVADDILLLAELGHTQTWFYRHQRELKRHIDSTGKTLHELTVGEVLVWTDLVRQDAYAAGIPLNDDSDQQDAG